MINGAVCFDHDTLDAHCVHYVEVDANGRAKIDPQTGQPMLSADHDLSPMVKWIGYSTYRADKPEDPEHLANYWVADHGQLIKFEVGSKGKADVITLKSDGQSLLLDVGLGSNDVVRAFILDTGATSMTVTSDMAAELVKTGHAEPNGSETVTYADGSAHPVQTVTIDTVRVGTHVLHDVHASVTPMGAPMLLGLDVLKSIGKFEIDAPHRTLIFNGGAS